MVLMAREMAIHEIKDQLSRVVSEVVESGDDVLITKHGRVVAKLTAAPPERIVLGTGQRPDGNAPDLEELRWSPEELDEMFGGAVFPE